MGSDCRRYGRTRRQLVLVKGGGVRGVSRDEHEVLVLGTRRRAQVTQRQGAGDPAMGGTDESSMDRCDYPQYATAFRSGQTPRMRA